MDAELSADQRHVDFHRRSERLKRSGKANIAHFVGEKGGVELQVQEVSDNASKIDGTGANRAKAKSSRGQQIVLSVEDAEHSTKIRRRARGVSVGSRCNGDLCTYYEDMERDQQERIAQRASAVTHKEKYNAQEGMQEKTPYKPWKARMQ